jgi:sugar O-acyltransferase (sialic acid O-acetyltransferase NeuD family)
MEANLSGKLKELIFIGGSNAVAEIINIIDAINGVCPTYEVLGALDDNEALHGSTIEGVKVLGPVSRWEEWSDAKFIFAIGSSKTRLKRLDILAQTDIPKDRFETLINPLSNVYKSATIGVGCIVHFGVTIGPSAKLSDFVIVAMGVNVGPNASLRQGALITSGVFIGSGTRVGPCAYIGASSSLAENITIGAGAMVGLGSVVYRSVPNGQLVLGNPAKPLFTYPVPDSLLKSDQD